MAVLDLEIMKYMKNICVCIAYTWSFSLVMIESEYLNLPKGLIFSLVKSFINKLSNLNELHIHM